MNEKQVRYERLTMICEKGKISFQNNFTVVLHQGASADCAKKIVFSTLIKFKR